MFKVKFELKNKNILKRFIHQKVMLGMFYDILELMGKMYARL